MNLKDKWVVTTDSLCEGVTADKDEQGRVILFTEDGAARAVLDSCMMIQDSRNEEVDYWEDLGVISSMDPDDVPYRMPSKDMEEGYKLAQEGTAEQISAFYDKHPDMDDGGFGWEPAEDFIDGRKAIWTANGGHIEGTSIKEMEVTND